VELASAESVNLGSTPLVEASFAALGPGLTRRDPTADPPTRPEAV